MNHIRTALAARGIAVLPGTSYVPLDLYGLLPDGRGLHVRFRGADVTVRLYGAADVALAVAIPEHVGPELPLGGEVWLPVAGMVGDPGVAPGRTVFTGPPLGEVLVDGRARYGWGAHGAGLLRGAAAADVLADVLADALGEPAEPALVRAPARAG